MQNCESCLVTEQFVGINQGQKVKKALVPAENLLNSELKEIRRGRRVIRFTPVRKCMTCRGWFFEKEKEQDSKVNFQPVYCNGIFPDFADCFVVSNLWLAEKL